MDNESLLDLGVISVGHRLKLLRAVWELKVEQGLEIGEEDWTPQGVPVSVLLKTKSAMLSSQIIRTMPRRK